MTPPRYPPPRTLNVDEMRLLVQRRMTEKQWQSIVLEIAVLGNWKVHYVTDSRRSPDGWPDLYMVRGEQTIAAELKTMVGKLTDAQRGWLEALAVTGVYTFLWRPSDEREVHAILLAKPDKPLPSSVRPAVGSPFP